MTYWIRLRTHEGELRRLGVSHAAVLGSVARGEAIAESDVERAGGTGRDASDGAVSVREAEALYRWAAGWRLEMWSTQDTEADLREIFFAMPSPHSNNRKYGCATFWRISRRFANLPLEWTADQLAADRPLSMRDSRTRNHFGSDEALPTEYRDGMQNRLGCDCGGGKTSIATNMRAWTRS